MVKEKQYFNKNERAIMALLFKERRPLSIREISEKTGLSWVTVKKWEKELENKGFLVKGQATQVREKKELNYEKVSNILKVLKERRRKQKRDLAEKVGI